MMDADAQWIGPTTKGDATITLIPVHCDCSPLLPFIAKAASLLHRYTGVVCVPSTDHVFSVDPSNWKIPSDAAVVYLATQLATGADDADAVEPAAHLLTELALIYQNRYTVTCIYSLASIVAKDGMPDMLDRLEHAGEAVSTFTPDQILAEDIKMVEAEGGEGERTSHFSVTPTHLPLTCVLQGSAAGTQGVVAVWPAGGECVVPLGTHAVQDTVTGAVGTAVNTMSTLQDTLAQGRAWRETWNLTPACNIASMCFPVAYLQDDGGDSAEAEHGIVEDAQPLPSDPATTPLPASVKQVEVIAGKRRTTVAVNGVVIGSYIGHQDGTWEFVAHTAEEVEGAPVRVPTPCTVSMTPTQALHIALVQPEDCVTMEEYKQVVWWRNKCVLPAMGQLMHGIVMAPVGEVDKISLTEKVVCTLGETPDVRSLDRIFDAVTTITLTAKSVLHIMRGGWNRKKSRFNFTGFIQMKEAQEQGKWVASRGAVRVQPDMEGLESSSQGSITVSQQGPAWLARLLTKREVP